MSEPNFASLDQLSMNKDSIQMYVVDQLPTESYSQGTEAMFPARTRMDKDTAEIQQLGRLTHELEQLKPQILKLEEALAKIYDDSERQLEIINDPSKQHKLDEIETYYRQLQIQQNTLEADIETNLTHSFQCFIQYVTLVPDNLITSWRYEKGYLLVFLKQRPTYFNADSNKVTFSSLWQYDALFTVRGKINDFHRKIYFEFIIIWRQ